MLQDLPFNVKFIFPKELQDTSKFIGYPNKHNFYVYDTIKDYPDRVYLSDIIDIFSNEGHEIESGFSLEQLIGDTSLFNDSHLVIILPTANVVTDNLVHSERFNIWKNVLHSCLRLLSKRPNSKLVMGCDWDEYNIANFYYLGQNYSFIDEILNSFRNCNVNLKRLCWLYSNTLTPQRIKERILINEKSPSTLYYSVYINRMKGVAEGEFNPIVSNQHKKTKWFLSLNRRPAFHRIFLSYWMNKHCYRPINLSIRQTSDNLDVNIGMIKNYLLENVTREDYDNFCKSLPLLLDCKSFDNPAPQDLLNVKLIHESACYIVTETWYDDMHDNYTGWFTEKTFKSFLYGLPTIYVAPQHTVKSFKKLGFKSYNHLIDESYDDEPDPKIRLQLIINNIKKIQQVEDIQSWYNKGYEVAQYNRQWLEKLFNMRMSDSIISALFKKELNQSNQL